MRAAVRLTREIFAQPVFGRYRGQEVQPGDAVRTDAEIDAFVRATCPTCSATRRAITRFTAPPTIPAVLQIIGPRGEDPMTIEFARLLAAEIGGFGPPPAYL